EHDAEVERTRGVCHAHGLADAAGLCELDVDAVRPCGAGRDVAQPMAVLVDVDRSRRGGLQAGTVAITGRNGLLAVRDTDRGLRRPLARGKSLLDRFERKGVLAEQLAVLLDVCKRGLRALSVAVDRGRLAEARDLAVTYLHEHDLGGVARLSRDDERLREL